MSQSLSFLDPGQLNLYQAALTNPNSTTDVWTFTNLQGGTIVKLTIVYTDTTKATISTITRNNPTAV